METSKTIDGIVIRCSSVKEMWNVCSPYTKTYAKGTTMAEWYGDKDSLRDGLFNGSNDLAARAEALAGKIPEIALPSMYARETVRDIFGTRLSVGDYTAGNPACFRRKRNQETFVAPIKIVVGVSTSASISVEQQQKRGIAVLAFVQLVQATRPVELFILDEGRDNNGLTMYFLTELNSKPLDCATASVALSHVGVSRQLMMEYEQEKHGNGSAWPSGYASNSPVYDASRRKLLGLTPKDVTIDSLYANDPFKDDPIGWVNNQLAQVKARMEVE